MGGTRDHEELRVVIPTEGGRELASNLALAVTFAVMTLLVALDLATDVRAGTTVFHAALEGAVIAIGLVGAARFALQVRRLAREAHDLRARSGELAANLEASRAEAARWRRDAADLIAGLSAAIDRQLDHWQLSPAEKEVAQLLLKGLSHKEIAQVREVSETTVRHQARTLYRKAGLSGRNDLAAFFLEDLLGPRTVPPAATAGARSALR